MIGSGGGFLFMPILLFLYRAESPETLTFISLFAVMVGAISATVRYGWMRRIDFRSGLAFGAATIPLAVVGRLVLRLVTRERFAPVFGLLLIVVGGLLFRRVLRREKSAKSTQAEPKPNWTRRSFVDAMGVEHGYAFSMPAGLGFSSLIGFLGSFFGIGGGIIHVPVMTQVLRFPVHIATATSILVLAVSSTTGVVTHLILVGPGGALELAMAAAVGALLGAQVGVGLSKKVSGRRILMILAAALLLVGWRLLVAAIFG